MLRYVVRRLGLFVLGLFVMTVVIFIVVRVLPGDVGRVIAGTNATPEQQEQIRIAYGLDRPLIAQYGDWLGGLFRFDLGTSLITGAPVSSELASKLQVSVPLCVMALVLACGVGIPLGVVAGLFANRPAGKLLMVSTQAAAAVPIVWAGMILIVLFGVGAGGLELMPSQGFPLDGWASPGRAFASLILPAVAIGIVEAAVVMRFVRSAMLEAAPQDYIRTARAKGLTTTQALIQHGLPNVSLALISVIGLQAASLITGAVVVEQLFVLPGVGSMLNRAVGSRDLVTVQSVVLTLTLFVLVVGLIVDIAHRLVDPRQRLQEVYE